MVVIVYIRLTALKYLLTMWRIFVRQFTIGKLFESMVCLILIFRRMLNGSLSSRLFYGMIDNLIDVTRFENSSYKTFLCVSSKPV